MAFVGAGGCIQAKLHTGEIGTGQHCPVQRINKQGFVNWMEAMRQLVLGANSRPYDFVSSYGGAICVKINFSCYFSSSCNIRVDIALIADHAISNVT